MSKKILVVSPYYPPHVGGLESHADEFNKYLVNDDFEVTVFTPRLPKETLTSEIKYKKVKIYRFPAFELIPNFPVPCFWKNEYGKQSKKISEEKYDWVISRTRFFLTSVLAGIWARKRKIKWLHIEHGSDFVKLNSVWKSFLARMFDYIFGRWILRQADKVVANSKASAEFCKKLYSKRKYQVIYRGVEIDKIIDNKVVREKYRNKVIILFAGRLIDGKGVSDLIEAMDLIKINDWILLLVGDGPRKSDLENQVKNINLENQVFFLGQMNHQDLMGILNVSDIVINPSYTEGIPTNIIEAAKCGKAIIATDVGGTREIIDDGISGILIPPKQPKILASKIKFLIENNEIRKQMGNIAKEKVKNSFDWKVSIKKYMEILK